MNFYKLDLSKLLHGFVNVFTLSNLFFVFLALFQTQQSWGLTKISKLVEASVLDKRWLMNQSTQCLGSVVPLAKKLLQFLLLFPETMFAKHILRNMAISRVIYGEIMPPGLSACTDSFYKTSNISGIRGRGSFKYHNKLWLIVSKIFVEM